MVIVGCGCGGLFAAGALKRTHIAQPIRS